MIEVDGLVRELGDTKVLDGITFRAPAGVVTGFLGPNGAGKTTTMRVLSTLLRPSAGTVRVGGFDVVKQADDVRQVIGLVTEEPGLLDRLTGREHLAFSGRAYGLSPARLAARIDEVAELLALGDNLAQRAGKLSKGNRQKIALARALVHDPPILLLDEPTANLDVVATANMRDLLMSPDVRGTKTVLLSTHALDEADEVCERVVGIAQGKVVAEGTKNEIAASCGQADFRDAFLGLLRAETLDAESVT
ncbi:MAG TPA: ABC transporter ATP-binding protein [Acidimicrobiales bacterium]|nr:ABC transporter ATP-binding protein [Acidimicrobiales bacterium]